MVKGLSDQKSRPHAGSKKIRVRIAEDLFSHQFFLKVIKSLLEHNREFGREFIVHAPFSDAMMVTIAKDDQQLVIATGGESDPYIYIKGETGIVREFVEYLTVEASTLIALEFCTALEKMCSTYSPEKMRKVLHQKIKEAIDEVLT